MIDPQGAELRRKLVNEITLTNQENYQADLECPNRLVSVLEMYCENTSSSIRGKLQNLQYTRVINFDPKVLDGIIQNNCSLLSNKYGDIVEAMITILPSSINEFMINENSF